MKNNGKKFFLSGAVLVLCVGLTACSETVPQGSSGGSISGMRQSSFDHSQDEQQTTVHEQSSDYVADDSEDDIKGHTYEDHSVCVSDEDEIFNTDSSCADDDVTYHPEYDQTDDDDFEYNIAKPIRLFSDYSQMRPFYSDVVAGAYGEQFSISMSQAAVYERYLEEYGYVLDTEAGLDDADRYIGLADDDWIFVIDHGNSVSFLYGGDVRLEGTGGTVTTVIVGGRQNNVPVYPDVVIPNAGITTGSDCPVCGGDGRVTCKGCNGLGYIAGVGYSSDYGYGSSSYETKNHCYTCGGSKESMCTRCLGSGRIQ